MAVSYIPTKDADLDNWAANFSTRITAAPGTFGLIAADATAIAAAYTSWHTLYLAAIAPATRTPVSVADKDTAKIGLLAIYRPYAVAISLNAGVLTSDKIEVGVNPRTNSPTPVAAPTSAPVVSLIGATYLQHLLRYRDEGAPSTSRAKPVNVLQIQIFAAVSTTVVSDPATLPLKAVATKVPVVVAWDSSDVGKVAYYASRWVTRTGLVGPWSTISNIVVV
jgi:hypothetical protein